MNYKVKQIIVSTLCDIEIEDIVQIKEIFLALKTECVEFAIKFHKTMSYSGYSQFFKKARVLHVDENTIDILAWQEKSQIKTNGIEFDSIESIEFTSDIARKIRHKKEFSELEFIDLGPIEEDKG